MNYGQHIRKTRQARGIKQHELARELGVSAALLSAWERGHKDMPEERWYAALAAILVISKQREREAEEQLAAARARAATLGEEA